MKLERIWLLVKPTEISTVGEVAFSVTPKEFVRQVLGGLREDEVLAFYDKEEEAREQEELLLKEYRKIRAKMYPRGNPLTRGESKELLDTADIYYAPAVGYPKGRRKSYAMGTAYGVASAVASKTEDMGMEDRADRLAQAALKYKENPRPVGRGSGYLKNNGEDAMVQRGGVHIDIHSHNNPRKAPVLIGRKIVKLVFDNHDLYLGEAGWGGVYGLEGGHIYIKGFFGGIPKEVLEKGRITEVWYIDEKKAKVDYPNEPLDTPFKHDFSKESPQALRVKGGLLLRAEKCPLWGMR